MEASPLRRIVAIADAAARWCDADFPPRVRATRALEGRTSYTEPVIDYALDTLFGELVAPALRTTIENELGTLAALDGFVPRAGRPAVSYRALARATIVSSDSTIGVAIPALAFALCAGCAVTVKDRDDRLVAAFAETLVEESPDLRDSIAMALWDGATADAAINAHLGEADVVVAYGGAAALAAIRARLRPDARFVPYGHRTSVGYVTRETLDGADAGAAAAAGIARDALLYDGEGCLSAHAVFVESGARMPVAAFARIVAEACDAAAIEFPAGYTERDAAVVAYRRAALFRAAQGAGAVYAGVVAPHLVVLDPPASEPPPLLRRTLAIYGIAGAGEAAAFVRLHDLPLEGVALSSFARDDVLAFARTSGASRIARLGTLQQPPLGGEHGGYGRILPFVRAIYRA